MIDSIGFIPNYSSASNAANAAQGEHQAFNAVFKQTVYHGYVGDGQVIPAPDDDTIQLLNEMFSSFDDSYNFWEIVLQLEEKTDIKALLESIAADFDNASGRSIIEALMTQLWKKKELSGENNTKHELSDLFRQNHISGSERNYIDSKAVSELETLILKNKKKKILAAV